MHEILYAQSSLLIVGMLLLAMVVSAWLGHRIGRARHPASVEPFRLHVNAIQASMLGLLALLVSFAFSLSLQRFDSRSEAVVDEANAIGTAYLRAALLPESLRGDAQRLLRRHADLRLQAAGVSLDRESDRQAIVGRTHEGLGELWALAIRAAAADPGPVTSGLFIQSLNEAIDAFGRRDAALGRHVPEVVWLLLFATFLACGGVVGYAAGLGGHRLSWSTYVLIALVIVLTFIVIDLDRPRRGLIQVDHGSLVRLKAGIDEAAGNRSPGSVSRP